MVPSSPVMVRLKGGASLNLETAHTAPYEFNMAEDAPVCKVRYSIFTANCASSVGYVLEHCLSCRLHTITSTLKIVMNPPITGAHPLMNIGHGQ